MVTALQILRIALLLPTVAFGLLLFSELSGCVIYDDWRLAIALTEDRSAPTEATRQELAAATVAHRNKRLTIIGVEALLFACGGLGIQLMLKKNRKIFLDHFAECNSHLI